MLKSDYSDKTTRASTLHGDTHFIQFYETSCSDNIDMANLQITLSYIVFRMAQSEPSSGVKGKAIYNKNLSN